MTPRDFRNIHTTGNSCRDALPCANIPWVFLSKKNFDINMRHGDMVLHPFLKYWIEKINHYK